MDSYFTDQKIEELTTRYNWELVRDGSKFLLRQKDKHYMTTVVFDVSDETASKYLMEKP